MRIRLVVYLRIERRGRNGGRLRHKMDRKLCWRRWFRLHQSGHFRLLQSHHVHQRPALLVKEAFSHVTTEVDSTWPHRHEPLDRV